MSSASSGQFLDRLGSPTGKELSPGAVISGLGIVTPLGVDRGEFYAGLRSGRCCLQKEAALGALALNESVGAARRQQLGERATAGRWAARLGEFGAAAAIDAGRRRRMPRLAQLAVVAARQALAAAPPAAQGVVERYGSERVAVVFGTGLGTLELTMEFETGYLKGGLAAASPALFPYTVMNTAAAIVAMELQLLGGNITVNHRDLSVHEAVATAVDLLAMDRADAVLCGGGDELGPWLQHGLERLVGSAAGAADEQPPLRPYDRQRRGLSLGEGAVMLLIERAAGARSRGARPLATLSGVARAGDQRPRLGWPAAGDPATTAGAAQAIRQSLQAAGLLPASLDFIVGSGNGTALDGLETQALRQALGSAAEKVPIASVLGQCGEWLTSAGARLGAALYALQEQALPGTTLCRDPDPQAALPGLVLTPRPATAPLRHVLVPALAQGGGNASLILSHPEAA
jgi:3-oxoacyl-[acyl-carrier-protein] synthase II